MRCLTWAGCVRVQYLYKPKDPCDDMYILRSGAVECRSVQGSDPTIRDRESSGGEGEIEIEVGDCFGEEALFPVCIFRRTETRASCQMIASWQWHSVPHAQVLVLVSQCQHICEPIRSVLV